MCEIFCILFGCFPINRFRYVYVCFAADLAAAGNKTLHILVIIFVVTFSLQWIIIIPIIGKYLI